MHCYISHATMDTRMRHDVILYLHFLSCSTLKQSIHVCFKKVKRDIDKHISYSLIEGLKIATGKRPFRFWIMSSATALLYV